MWPEFTLKKCAVLIQHCCEHGVQQFDQSRKWIITEFIHSNSRIYRKFYWRKDGTGKIRYCINPFRTLLSLIANSFLVSGNILLSADIHFKQSGPRSGPTESNHLTIWWCSWNNFLKKLISKNPADDKKACKNYPACKLRRVKYYWIHIFHFTANMHVWIHCKVYLHLLLQQRNCLTRMHK